MCVVSQPSAVFREHSSLSTQPTPRTHSTQPSALNPQPSALSTLDQKYRPKCGSSTLGQKYRPKCGFSKIQNNKKRASKNLQDGRILDPFDKISLKLKIYDFKQKGTFLSLRPQGLNVFNLYCQNDSRSKSFGSLKELSII